MKENKDIKMIIFKDKDEINLENNTRYDIIATEIRNNKNKYGLVKTFKGEGYLKKAAMFKYQVNNRKIKAFSDEKFSCVIKKEKDFAEAYIIYEEPI